jgi:hypothetical protein
MEICEVEEAINICLGRLNGLYMALNGEALGFLFVKDQLSIEEEGCEIKKRILYWLERRSEAENG